MRRTSFLWALVMIGLSVAWPVCNASAEIMSRVELKDGTVYEQVDVDVDDEFKVIIIKAGDWTVKASFSQVALLFDADGVDVTSDVLEGRRREAKPGVPSGGVAGPGGSAPAPTANATTTTKRRRWPLGGGISVHGHPSFLVGTWWEGFDPGLGYGVDGFVAVGKNMALRGMVSKTGLGVPDYASPVGFSVWRYFLAFQWHDWPHWRSDGKYYWYVYTGLGAAAHSAGGWSSTKFAQNLGAGITTMLSPTIGLDFSGCMDVLYIGQTNDNSYSASIYGNYQTALILELRVGLTAVIK